MPNAFVDNLKEKATEISTWAGLGAIGTAFKIGELAVLASPEVALALAGIAAIFFPEKKILRRRAVKKAAAAATISK